MEVKIDEKSIKKWSQDGKASWHRFLMDFGGFLEASWEGKWSQDRSQEASKKRWKNGRHQDGYKIEIRRSNPLRSEGSRALGRSPPKSGADPSPPWRWRETSPEHFCLPKSCLVLSLSCLVLSCLALSCPVLSCLGSIFLLNLHPKIHQNPLKTHAKMPSHLDFIFRSIFHRFLPPTSIP